MSLPVAAPHIALRKEHDDWGVLFDPDTGKGFGVDPVGMFIWDRLDGRHSAEAIGGALRAAFNNVPPEAVAHVEAFVGQLRQKGLVVEVRPGTPPGPPEESPPCD